MFVSTAKSATMARQNEMLMSPSKGRVFNARLGFTILSSWMRRYIASLQRGQVGWNTVKSGNDLAFKSHVGFSVVSLE